MRFLCCLLLGATALAAVAPFRVRAEEIDGRVIQVELPAEDITLYYVERRGCFTVKMETKSAVVEGPKLYIGDGRIAIDLVAHTTKGILLQGVAYHHGDQFKNGAKITVRRGFREMSALRPGDVYVVLPGVTFDVPGR